MQRRPAENAVSIEATHVDTRIEAHPEEEAFCGLWSKAQGFGMQRRGFGPGVPAVLRGARPSRSGYRSDSAHTSFAQVRGGGGMLAYPHSPHRHFAGSRRRSCRCGRWESSARVYLAVAMALVEILEARREAAVARRAIWAARVRVLLRVHGRRLPRSEPDIFHARPARHTRQRHSRSGHGGKTSAQASKGESRQASPRRACETLGWHGDPPQEPVVGGPGGWPHPKGWALSGVFGKALIARSRSQSACQQGSTPPLTSSKFRQLSKVN